MSVLSLPVPSAPAPAPPSLSLTPAVAEDLTLCLNGEEPREPDDWGRPEDESLDLVVVVIALNHGSFAVDGF
jgi:hypothetical protein